MAEYWMQKAFANSHGQFKAKAKKAGKSVAEMAAHPGKNASTKTKRQANLAEMGMKYGGGHHSSQPHPKTNPGCYDTEARLEPYNVGTAHQFPRPAAPNAHGYGHGAHVRSGNLRLSGTPGAHRIGKR